MRKREKAKERRVHREVEFVLGEGQTLFVSCGGMIRPGLSRIFVENKGGKVKVWADATSGSYFSFRKGYGRHDFQLLNLDYRETLENFLHRKFWNQFNWSQLFVYAKNEQFNQAVDRRIKKLVAEFEAHAAKELNAIPRPSKK